MEQGIGSQRCTCRSGIPKHTHFLHLHTCSIVTTTVVLLTHLHVHWQLPCEGVWLHSYLDLRERLALASCPGLPMFFNVTREKSGRPGDEASLHHKPGRSADTALNQW